MRHKVSYFCKFCGKVLTTGDDIDRCNPSCITKTMIFPEIKKISFDTLKYQYDQLKAENERLREAIELLQNWVQAYPISVFPEPDLKLARKLLTDGGVSYDALNAYSMRHVINGVGKIIDEALEVTK